MLSFLFVNKIDLNYTNRPGRMRSERSDRPKMKGTYKFQHTRYKSPLARWLFLFRLWAKKNDSGKQPNHNYIGAN